MPTSYSSCWPIAIWLLMTLAAKGGPLTAPINVTPRPPQIPANRVAVQAHGVQSSANQLAKVMTDGRVALLQLKNARAVPSQVLHSISADGKIYVMNQNGVIFGTPRQIDTHALTSAAMKPMVDAAAEEAKRQRVRESDSVISATVVGFGEKEPN
jgi:filamentous hemagglutinin family protein